MDVLAEELDRIAATCIGCLHMHQGPCWHLDRFGGRCSCRWPVLRSERQVATMMKREMKSNIQQRR